LSSVTSSVTSAVHAAPHHPFAQARLVAWTGLLCLAVAMGIGRFAFTPLLPLMLQEGRIGLPQASGLATANYLGYGLGALFCALQPWLCRRWPAWPHGAPTRMLRWGLAATVVLTLGMALPWVPAWSVWRFLAGVASAWVFVFTSSWCLGQLMALGLPQWSGVIYAGPGVGIAVSGLVAMALVAEGASAALSWSVLAGLALLMTAGVWARLREDPQAVSPPQPIANQPPSEALQPARLETGLDTEVWALVLAYGMAGFGYIITATFMPVMARQALPGSIWLDLFWPLFGVGVSVGALCTLRLPVHWDRRPLLMGAYVMQALGVVLGVWWPSLAGFAWGSLLVGLPFTAIPLFAMQEARRLRPQGAAALMGGLTASYGVGQIAGPLWVRHVLAHASSTAQGFAVALYSASGALLLGWLLYACWVWQYPLASRAQA
jgi:MFS family permease